MSKRRLLINENQLDINFTNVSAFGMSRVVGTDPTNKITSLTVAEFGDLIVQKNSSLSSLSAITFEPATGFFGTITFAENGIAVYNIGDLIFLRCNIRTSSLNYGTASGQVKLRLNPSLNTILKAGQSPAIRISDFEFDGSKFNSLITRVLIVAEFGNPSYFSLRKNTGNVNNTNTESIFQVSDLKEHTSGSENQITIYMTLCYQS